MKKKKGKSSALPSFSRAEIVERQGNTWDTPDGGGVVGRDNVVIFKI